MIRTLQQQQQQQQQQPSFYAHDTGQPMLAETPS